MKITKTLRVFLIILSVMMVLPLFACGDTPEETTTKAPEQTTAPKEETTTDKKVETTEPKADATTAEPEAPATTVAPEETTEAETTSAETTEATTESGSETTETGSESSETETTEFETTAAPACDHVEEEIPAVAPTCEETGLTAGAKCSLCGEILEEQEPVEAIGHKWDEGKVTTEPDCDNAGVKIFTCQNDATHTKTEAIDELGHAWDEGKVTAEPKCGVEGVMTYTCGRKECGITKEEPIDALEHVAGEPSTDPEDKCALKCTVCGALLDANKHSMGDTWAIDTESPQNEFTTCSVCGVKETRPATTTLEGLTLLTPEYLASMPKHANIETVTVETDENGMKYYHAVTKASGNEATLIFNTGETAMMGVGNYVAMLIRKTAGEPSIECWINYAGRTDHTDGNGARSATTSTKPVACNGEWQLLIFDFTGKDQMSVENGIGWARFDISNGTISSAEESDIAFAGFFDSTDDVYAYYRAYVEAYDMECVHVGDGVEKPSKTTEGKVCMTCTVCGEECNIVDCAHNNPADWTVGATDGYRGGTCSLCESTINTKIAFTVALDTSNCSLNGERGKFVAGARRIDEPWVIDASVYTLTQVDGIGIGGWCVTPEGIAKYQYRVVSVDGAAVENPTLVDYFTGVSSDGVTQVGVGRGWSESCGNGAAWQSPRLLNLAGYEGKTVSVEVVATTTYGAQIVIMQINNIAVPAAQ